MTDGFKFVFIVSYGRSGSTLLQGILNSIPGYVIRGENGGALYDLFQFHAKIDWERKRYAMAAPLDSRHPFFGIDGYTSAQAIRDMRTLLIRNLLRPSLGTRALGFKEIRWFQHEWEDYIGFIQELFPGAQFVINTRDLNDVAKSKWWAKKDDPLAALVREQERLEEIDNHLGERAYRVHYDEYVANLSTLEGMYSWLGERFDPEAIADVLKRRHSY